MTKPKVTRRSRGIRQWMERLFLLAGLAAVGVWSGSYATLWIWQRWENWVFEQEVRRIEPTARGVPEPGPRPVIIRHNGLVGRLTIPRLHLSAIVREGTGEDTLGLAAGHIPSTALPGQKGNVAVAGHRDTLFRGLGEIRQDDVIRFETLYGNYAYQVSGTEIVKPQNVGVLRAGSIPELTLVTCYPFSYFGSAPDRFIVKAREVSASEQAPSETRRQILQEAAEEAATPRGPRRIGFSVSKDHSRQLVPGISLGLTGTDAIDHRVDGWMWLMPDRRTIWLRDHRVKDPVVFYGYLDGKRRELQITSVSQNSVTGYLVVER